MSMPVSPDMMRRLLYIAVLLASQAKAATIIVPDNASTIQGAMIAAASGDTVLVRPGTYFENVNFLGKAVILRSLAGPATTIIDGSAGGIAVAYMRDVPDVARLEGFTLRGGGGVPSGTKRFGGGVCVRDSLNQQPGLGPLIRDNWITGNHATEGGGIFIGGICRVTNNRIYLNEAQDNGGGITRGEIRLNNQNPRVVADNEIFSNRVTLFDLDRGGGGATIQGSAAGLPFEFVRNIVACNDAWRAGGVYATSSDEDMLIEGNTVVLNSAAAFEGGGIRFLLFSAARGVLTVSGNVVAFNISGIKCVADIGADPPVMDCNDIFGNLPDVVDGACGQVIGVNNNFSADPLFGQVTGCPPASGDFCLSDESPLLPENSPPGCGLIGALGACLPIGVPGLDPAPSILAIHAAKPNPFSDSATIPFELPAPGEVRVTIYNARGEAVLIQPSRQHSAGTGNVVWDGRDRRGERCPPGVYFARIEVGDRALSARVVLVY